MLNTSSLPGGTRWPRAASSVRLCGLVGGEMQAPLVSNFRIHGSGLLPGLFKPLQPCFAWLCKCFGRRPSGIPRSRTRELYGSLLYAPGPSVFRLWPHIYVYTSIFVCVRMYISMTVNTFCIWPPSFLGFHALVLLNHVFGCKFNHFGLRYCRMMRLDANAGLCMSA